MNILFKLDFLNLPLNLLFLVDDRSFESTSLLYYSNFLVRSLQRLYFDNNDAHRISIRRNKYSMLKKQYKQY